MSDADWKCDLCGRKQGGGEKPPQGWVNTQRPCGFSGEMEDVAICGSCMACLDAARLADVNGLAERIAEYAQDDEVLGVSSGSDFDYFNSDKLEEFIRTAIAPLLAENERRLKLLVECRPYMMAGFSTGPDLKAMLTRIDKETGGK